MRQLEATSQWRESCERALGLVRIEADQDHPAPSACQRLCPFGASPEHEARDAEPRRLALYPARIGQDSGRLELEAQGRPIAQWPDDDHRRGKADPRRGQGGPGPRMEGQEDRAVGERHPAEERCPGAHRVRLAVLLAGDRREQEAPGLHQEPADRVKGGRIAHLSRHSGRQVLHQVADQRDPIVDPLGGEVLDGGRRRGEPPPGEVIHGHPVQLFGHPAVEASEAGFDMRDRDSELRRRQTTGERRVRVAVDQDSIGLLGGQERLQRDEHPARLVGVAAPVDPEAVVRAGQAKLVEEAARHRVVVVLTGVDERFVVPGPQRRLQGSGLDQLRPGPDNREDVHESARGRATNAAHLQRLAGATTPARSSGTPTPTYATRGGRSVAASVFRPS